MDENANRALVRESFYSGVFLTGATVRKTSRKKLVFNVRRKTPAFLRKSQCGLSFRKPRTSDVKIAKSDTTMPLSRTTETLVWNLIVRDKRQISTA